MGGTFLTIGSDESAKLNAIYDAFVAVEEHDLSIGKYEIDKKQFVEHLRSQAILRKAQTFKAAGRAEFFARAFGETAVESVNPTLPADRGERKAAPPSREIRATGGGQATRPTDNTGQGLNVGVVVGDDNHDCTHLGIVGQLKHDRRHLGITFSKPLCMVVLGYMGSGKSYALGVLIENALLAIPQLTRQTKPLSVIAFNYRRNPEARFEYWGFGEPNCTRARG